VLVSQSGRRDRLPRSSAHANPNPLANIRQGVRHRPLYIAQRPPGILPRPTQKQWHFARKKSKLNLYASTAGRTSEHQDIKQIADSRTKAKANRTSERHKKQHATCWQLFRHCILDFGLMRSCDRTRSVRDRLFTCVAWPATCANLSQKSFH